MMIPIALGLITRLEGPESAKRRYAAALILMTAYASTAGGVATKVGTGTNAIGIRTLTETANLHFDFVDWARFGGPIALLQVGILLAIFRWYAGRDEGRLRIRAGSVGPGGGGWTPAQAWTAGAFALAVALWTVPSLLAQARPDDPGYKALARAFHDSVVPFLALGLLALVRKGGKPVLDWRRVMAVDWDVLLLFAGGVSLGALSFETGLAKWAGDRLVGLTGADSLWGMTAAFTVIAIFVSELSSNVATASMLVPVAVAAAHSAGVSPVPPALAVTIASSLGCMMPISTPPNALAYGTGRVPLRTMLGLGLVFDLLGFLTVFLGLRLILPYLGWA
jgi:sodium-dependent dicarboxylate transporter 2/3/5